MKTPSCPKTCANKGFDFKTDRSYGKLAFRSGASVGEVQTEILKRGPVTAGFVVYDDFFLYKEGIYRVTEGAQPVGGHAIEVYGWLVLVFHIAAILWPLSFRRLLRHL